MEFNVRVATLVDAPAVGALLRESYPKLMASSYDIESLTPALDLMTKPNPSLLGSGKYYVAELPTGLIIGCGGWSLEQPGTGRVEPNLGHIRHFSTHPNWTRIGVGRAIFRACESFSSLAGVSVFECYSSLNAERFYASLGFKSIREIDIEFQPGIEFRAVLMRNELQASHY